MNTTKLMLSLCLAGLATAASAQTAADYTQRDVNQETRIRDGLQDGSLNTREAAILERKEGRVDRMQSRALSDGKLTDAERARLTHAESGVSQDIHGARHNGIEGNPLSASSQRMQEGVQRDINQQRRVENGIKDGQLTNREAGRLERGQARTDSREFRAGRDGHVGAHEAQAINDQQNSQSERIHRLRHNAAHRAG